MYEHGNSRSKTQVREYYEAYDDRYRQVHGEALRWFSDVSSPILSQVITQYGVSKEMRILEIGCGEGRDSLPLLRSGYNLLATDVSPAAICYCRKQDIKHREAFQVLDCLAGVSVAKYDFIYAIAVIHMLVSDTHRNLFYRFIHEHLRWEGISLICTQGDGTEEWQSDTTTAFDLQERVHQDSGITLRLAGTSYRKVSFSTFHEELRRNGFQIVESGLTAILPDYSEVMYAIVKQNE